MTSQNSTLNCSSTNEAVLLKFSRSKGYSKHQSDCEFRAVILTWKLHLHAIIATQKLLNLLVLFILHGTLVESPSFLVNTISWHAQPFAHIRNLWFCTKEVTK